MWRNDPVGLLESDRADNAAIMLYLAKNRCHEEIVYKLQLTDLLVVFGLQNTTCNIELIHAHWSTNFPSPYTIFLCLCLELSCVETDQVYKKLRDVAFFHGRARGTFQEAWRRSQDDTCVWKRDWTSRAVQLSLIDTTIQLQHGGRLLPCSEYHRMGHSCWFWQPLFRLRKDSDVEGCTPQLVHEDSWGLAPHCGLGTQKSN